jgi:predicted SAM-dependent methyltransferase
VSSSRYKINPLVCLATPTLEPRPISWPWMEAYQALQFPLGASVSRLRIHGQDVAEARNAIVASALEMGADYVLMLGDDNLAPPNLFALLHRHRQHLVTGVYWQKGYPTHPYLWDGLLKGFCEDWKLGEYFAVDFAGCDALLAHTDVFRAIEPPWFSRDWVFEPGQAPTPLLTEDFYFYTKARRAGFRLWVDTAAQLGHQDRNGGAIFQIEPGMPQWDKDAPHPSGDPPLLVADIGAGHHSPWFGSKAVVKRFDIDPATRPDVRCDIRAIPEPDETFDVVSTRHTLEHFMWDEAPALVREWTRILKVGGEFRVNVPNLAYAAREILRADEDAAYDAGLYPLWQVYGKQVGAYGEVHRNGFTRHGLARLLASCGLAGIRVEVSGELGENLDAVATKAAHPAPLAIGPLWREIAAQEAGPAAPDARPAEPAGAALLAPAALTTNGAASAPEACAACGSALRPLTWRMDDGAYCSWHCLPEHWKNENGENGTAAGASPREILA